MPAASSSRIGLSPGHSRAVADADHPPHETPRPDRRAVGGALLVACAVAAAQLTLVQWDQLLIGAFGDDGVYVTLGRAIARGEGYRSIHLPGSPIHGKYPPGLPLLLAVLWSWTDSIRLVQAAGIVLSSAASGAAAGLLWWTGRQRLGLHPILLGVFAIAPLLLDASASYLSLIISEPYYLLGWAAALAQYDRVGSARGARSRDVAAVALGLTLACTALVRLQALVLVPAFVWALWVRYSSRRAPVLCAAAAILPPIVWHLLHLRLMTLGPVASQPDESYLAFVAADGLMTLPRLTLVAAQRNAAAYVSMLSSYIGGVRPLSLLPLAGGLALLVLGGAGAWRRHPAIVATVAMNIVTVVAWPFAQDRFVLALLPFAGLLMALAAQRALRAGGSRRAAVMLAVAVSSVLVASRQMELRRRAGAETTGAPSVNSPSAFLPQNSRFIAGVSGWVRTNTAEHERLLVDYPAGVFLYSGRQGAPAEPAESSVAHTAFAVPGAYLASAVARDGVSVVVLGRLDGVLAREVAAIQQRCPGALRYVGRLGAGTVPAFYRIADRRCIGASFAP